MKLLVPVAAADVPAGLAWVGVPNAEWQGKDSVEEAGEFQRRTSAIGAVRYLRLVDGSLDLARPQFTLKRKAS